MFRFKQFSIDDTLCAMKVGTDGVLLGAWAQTLDAERVLDLGTGSGLIALMIAQITARAQITALDIDEAATRQAQHNVAFSPWAARIRVVQEDFCKWDSPQLFDAIITNPPFFRETLQAPNYQRALARHTQAGLDFSTLISRCAQSLRLGGSLQLIVPKQAEKELLSLARLHHFFPLRITDVHTVEHKPPKRILIHWVKGIPVDCQHTTLVLMRNGQRSEEYSALCQAFYL